MRCNSFGISNVQAVHRPRHLRIGFIRIFLVVPLGLVHLYMRGFYGALLLCRTAEHAIVLECLWLDGGISPLLSDLKNWGGEKKVKI